MVPEESKPESGSARDPKSQPRRRGRGGAGRRSRGRRGPRQPGEQQAEQKIESDIEARATVPLADEAGNAAPTPQDFEGAPKSSEPAAPEHEEAQPVEPEEATGPSTREPEREQPRAAEASRPAEPQRERERIPEQRPQPSQQSYQHQEGHGYYSQRRGPTHQATQGPESAIAKAIEQVNGITQSLKEALDDMDEVLETLELAERQKAVDEHEIESLKRALRGLQQRPSREQQQSRGSQRPHD